MNPITQSASANSWSYPNKIVPCPHTSHKQFKLIRVHELLESDSDSGKPRQFVFVQASTPFIVSAGIFGDLLLRSRSLPGLDTLAGEFGGLSPHPNIPFLEAC
jgi:hypothetical protein